MCDGSDACIVCSSMRVPANAAEGTHRWLMATRTAVFPDELAADNAAVALKDSGIADGDAIGILAVLGVRVLGGTAAGALHHKNLGLTDADKARLTVELTAGKAAVGVLAHSDTAPALSDRLTQLGETPEAHQLSDEALQTATGLPTPA
jgi:hypothetical protein